VDFKKDAKKSVVTDEGSDPTGSEGCRIPRINRRDFELRIRARADKKNSGSAVNTF